MLKFVRPCLHSPSIGIIRRVATKARPTSVASTTVSESRHMPFDRANTSACAEYPQGPQSYLEVYKFRDLFSFFLLSIVVSSPLLLNTAIKALPWTPEFFIRSFISPIYCGGATPAEVRRTGEQLLKRGISNFMLSYAVEDANGTADRAELTSAVKQILRSIPEVLVPHNNLATRMRAEGKLFSPPASGYIALKPTGLMENSAQILANYDNRAYAEQWKQYLDVCRRVCKEALTHGHGKIVIVFDAEKYWLQQGVYAAQREMMREFNVDGIVLVCGTVQMYLQGSVDFLRKEIELARDGGYQICMKLVRGAYLHSEPNRDVVIHSSKEDSDKSYNNGANLMLNEMIDGWKNGTASPVGRLVVATHNADSCRMIDERVSASDVKSYFEEKELVVFGQLMGMNDSLSDDLARHGQRVVKYAPWGPIKETKEYLCRRLEENSDAARGGWDEAKRVLRELLHRLCVFSSQVY